MIITIWNKVRKEYIKGQDVEISSISDEASCSLAYIHAMKSSVSSMQHINDMRPKWGDIFVVEAEGDERCYELSFDDDVDGPVFTKVEFQHE